MCVSWFEEYFCHEWRLKVVAFEYCGVQEVDGMLFNFCFEFDRWLMCVEDLEKVCECDGVQPSPSGGTLDTRLRS